MGMYRTLRPMIVDAVQCEEPRTIATDLGFINAKRGEWVICGEGGECYIVARPGSLPSGSFVLDIATNDSENRGASALAGYRNDAVYLRNSRHVPPRLETVRDPL
jgi:hypothetical protein